MSDRRRFMLVGHAKILLWTAVACLLVPAGMMAQDAAKKSPDSAAPKCSTASTEKKPALAEATRVSTEEATRSAAQKQTKGSQGEGAAEKPAEPDVLEFRPAPQTAEPSSGTASTPAKGKKSALKNVHGSVYGSADARHTGTHRTGGSAGASSKSGKTSVSVAAESARTESPSH